MSKELGMNFEITNLYSPGEVAEMSVAKAMAIRAMFENERVNFIMSQSSGSIYEPTDLDILEDRIQQIVPIYDEILKDPSSLDSNMEIIRKYFFAKSLSEKMSEEGTRQQLEDASGLNAEIFGQEVLVGTYELLRPFINVSQGDEIRIREVAKEISRQTGVPEQLTFLDESIYSDVMRQAYDPAEFAERSSKLEEALTAENFKSILVNTLVNSFEPDMSEMPESFLLAAILHLFDPNVPDPRIVLISELRHELEESLDTEEGRIQLETMVNQSKSTAFGGVADFLLRYWGEEVKNEISPTARLRIFETQYAIS